MSAYERLLDEVEGPTRVLLRGRGLPTGQPDGHLSESLGDGIGGIVPHLDQEALTRLIHALEESLRVGHTLLELHNDEVENALDGLELGTTENGHGLSSF